MVRYNVISYLIGDGIKNITKNKKSTISAIVVMVVTMLTIGLCFVTGENVKAVLTEMEEGYPISVYIEDGTTEAEKAKLEEQLKEIEFVNGGNIKHVNKKEAYYEAKEKLGESVLVGYTEDEHPFPESFVVTLTNLEKSSEVSEKIQKLDHVKDTSEKNTTSQSKKLVSFRKKINIIIAVVGGALSIFSIIIIGNTIKLTVHARRKEISIMKYVGATNNFIRAPFVVEGIIIGLISSLISVTMLGGIYVWVKRSVIGNLLGGYVKNFGMSVGMTNLLPFDQILTKIIAIFLVLGIGIGVFGSARSMKKYLKV